jgi:hypothetical protein
VWPNQSHEEEACLPVVCEQKKKIRKKLIKNIYIKKQTKDISLFIIDYTIQSIVKNIKITKKNL